MNKLKLTLEELRVTTFVTAGAEHAERGTVVGNAATRNGCGETGGICPQTGASPECEVTYAYTCLQSCGCETAIRCETSIC
ncbi:MAG TPA: hypothetical protein VF625_07020 [Longimicrobium sp.]|jgi:hypothetical protein